MTQVIVALFKQLIVSDDPLSPRDYKWVEFQYKLEMDCVSLKEDKYA